MIFTIKLHRHHYLSIVLIILLGLAIDLITNNLQNEIVNEPADLIMKFVKQVFFSLYNVMAKYVMEKKYVSVYEFSFYVGLFNLIVFLIFAIFDYYFIKLTPFGEYFKKFDIKQLFIVLGVIFSQLVINITSLFTAKYNSPCHIFIIFVFGQIAYYIDFSGNISLVIIIFTIFILIIILFLSLIFNEIIEINFFGLSYNTRKNIMIRAEIEAIGKSKYEYGSEKDSESVNENEKEKEKEADKGKENKDEKNDDSCEDPENSLNSKKRQIIYDDNYYFKI